MTDLSSLLSALAEGGVRFIVVGGMAGIAHGAARLTFDIDCVYARDDENIARLAGVMARFQPTLRGAPAGLPFRFDVPTIRAGLNFTLDTTAGPVTLRLPDGGHLVLNAVFINPGPFWPTLSSMVPSL